MSTRPTRRSLIGSYRYAVVIKPQENEFSETMSGTLDMYDGKHVTESHKFTSFDQLADTIITFWEQKIGSEVNVHRFSNWLSEYFTDIGITNINFYQLIETVRNLGRGVALTSSGLEIREAKVIAEPLQTPAERGVPDILAEISTPEAAVKNQLLKPSEMFIEEETVSPTVTTLPPIKEEKEEEVELPPDDTLLKPTEVLKKRDTIVMIEDRPSVQAMGVTGDPVVTKASPKIEKEPPPTETLLRPSEYLKKRETIDVIFGSTTSSSQYQEQKKTRTVEKTPVKQRKLAPPSEKLLRPSEYLKMREIMEEEEAESLKITSDAVQKQTDNLLQTLLKPPRIIDIEERKIPVPPLTEEKTKTVKPKPPSEKKKPELPFEIEIAEDEEPVKKPKPSVKKPTPKPIAKTEPLAEDTSFKLTDIEGVRDKTAMLLKEGGFDSLEKIINASPKELSKVKGIGEATAMKIISNAKALAKKAPTKKIPPKAPVKKTPAKKPDVKPVDKEEPVEEKKAKLEIIDIMGIGDKTVMMLNDGGYDSIEKLVSADPEELSKVRGIGPTTAKKLIYGAKALKHKEK